MDRPKVIVLNSASLDGKLAISHDRLLLYGDERWKAIEGAAEFNAFERLKSIHQPQATLEGSGSFVRETEEPGELESFMGNPATLFNDYLPEAIVQHAGLNGWFSVVDGRGRIRWMYTHEFPDEAWKGWFLLVLVCRATPVDYLAYLLREQVPYLVAGEKRVNLRLALEKMHAKLNVRCVLSTAGGKLNGALLRHGLVDEVNIEFLPALIGGIKTPSLFTMPALGTHEMPTMLKLISAEAQADGRVWLRYEVEQETRQG